LSLYLKLVGGSLGLSLALAYLFTPWAGALALRYGAAHAPRARDVHTKPVPRWGGIAIFLAFALTLLAVAAFVQFYLRRPLRPATLRAGGGLLAAGVLLTVIGAVDDRWEISAGKQLLAQLLAAAIVIPLGVKINFLTNPLQPGGLTYVGWLSVPLTVIWLIGVTNAMNWIDGIDGLAAGVGAIGSGTMALMAAQRGQPAVALLAAAGEAGVTAAGAVAGSEDAST